MSGLSSLFSFGSSTPSSAAAAATATTPNAIPAVASSLTASTHLVHASTSGTAAEPIANPRYRAFQDALASSLLAFDSVREWSDLIAALGKVSKTLQTKRFQPGMSEGCTLHLIPQGIAINLTKRLAQCLNSGLPAGVHLKALEVYELIFERLGPNGLIPTLSIYSIGLFPLFQYASSRVKPIVLDILLRRYVSLGPSLLPALPGFLLALLPGLEEEAGEFREPVLDILEKVRALNTHLFMMCLWRLILSSPQIRLAGANYLTTILPKPTALIPGTSPNTFYSSSVLQLSRFLSTPTSLTISALLAALHSRENVLTQRKILELILSHFPLKESHSTAAASTSTTTNTIRRESSSTTLTHPTQSPSSSTNADSVFTFDEQLDLLDGALDVLLFQDVSLSRRFFTWILTNNSTASASITPDPSTSAIPPHSLQLLQTAFERMLQRTIPELTITQPLLRIKHFPPAIASSSSISTSLTTILRPFQLLSILLDRVEIAASPLLSKLQLPLLCYVFILRDRILEYERLLNQQGDEGTSGTSDHTGFKLKVSKHVQKYRQAQSPSSSSSNSVAMDHIHAFYDQIGVTPVWRIVWNHLHESNTQFQDTLTSRLPSADLDEQKVGAESNPTPQLSADVQSKLILDPSLQSLCESMDLQLQLVDFICDFLPVSSSFSGPPSAPSSVPPTPTSAAAATPLTSTPQRRFSSQLHPRSFSTSSLDQEMPMMSILNVTLETIYNLASIDAFESVNFGFELALRKILPSLSGNDTPLANEANGWNIIPAELIEIFFSKTPQLMTRMLQRSESTTVRIRCIDQLFQLCDILLNIPSDVDNRPFLVRTSSAEVGAPIQRSRTGSSSVSKEAAAELMTTLQFLDIDPPSTPHSQLLRVYQIQLITLLRSQTDNRDYLLIGLTHWIGLAERWSSKVFHANDSSLLETISFILHHLWQLLQPSSSHLHTHIVKLFGKLVQIEATFVPATAGIPSCVNQLSHLVLQSTPNLLIESYTRLALLHRLMLNLTATTDPTSSVSPVLLPVNFSRLIRPWTWILLDGLNPSTHTITIPYIRSITRNWLQDTLTHSFEHITDSVLDVLLHLHTLRRPASPSSSHLIYNHIFDQRQILYALHLLRSILDVNHTSFIEILMRRKPTTEILDLFELHSKGATTSAAADSSSTSSLFATDASFWTRPRTYLQLIALTLLKFLQSHFQGAKDESSQQLAAYSMQNDRIRLMAAELLQSIASRIPVTSVSVQFATVMAPQILLVLAESIGIHSRTNPTAIESETDSNGLLQLQLLPLLQVLLLECNRRTDFTDAIYNSQPAHPLLAHPLFLQTIIGGLKFEGVDGTLNTNVNSSKQAVSSPLALQADGMPRARSVISSLSLLPTSIQSLCPSLTEDVLFPPTSSSTSTPTLATWLSFIQAILPLLRSSLPSVVAAVVSTICGELQNNAMDLKKRVTPTTLNNPVSARQISPIETCQIYLDGLKSILTFCLSAEHPPLSSSSSSFAESKSSMDTIPISPAAASETTAAAPPDKSEKPESMASSMLTSFTSVFSSSNSKQPVTTQQTTVGFEVHTKEGLYSLMPAIMDALLGLWSLNETTDRASQTLCIHAREMIETLLQQNPAKTLQAIEILWQRSLAELINSPSSDGHASLHPSWSHAANRPSTLTSAFELQQLAPDHHRILHLFNSLSLTIGAPHLLLACLIPLTLQAIAKSSPHARKNKSGQLSSSPSPSSALNPLSSPTTMAGMSVGLDAVGSSVSMANSAATNNQEHILIARLEEAELGYLHLIHSLMKYSTHVNSLTGVWSKQDATSSSSGGSTPSNGSLSQLYTSSQLQQFDHPLIFMWLLSIMQMWLHRTGVLNAGGANLDAKSSTSQNSSAGKSESMDGSTIDKKTLREIQGCVHQLFTLSSGLIGDHIEMRVDSVANVFGVPLPLLPPAIYFIAPRDELNDLLPPLPPWLDVVAHSTPQVLSSRHPSWPHVQLTVHRNQLEWNRLQQRLIPIATGNLLIQTPSIVSSTAPVTNPSWLSTPSSGINKSTHGGGKLANKPRCSLSLSLLVVRCISNVLATMLLDAFSNVSAHDVTTTTATATLRTESEQRGVTLLNSLLPVLLPTLHNHQPINLPFVTPVVTLLASLSTAPLSFTFKTWKGQAWDHFFYSVDSTLTTIGTPVPLEKNFFCTDVVTLEQFRWVLSRCIAEEKNLLSSFFALDRSSLNLETFASQIGGGVSSLFTSKESELTQRRSALRKLAFILHAGRKDQYARHLSGILERIMENLKILPSPPVSTTSKEFLQVEQVTRSILELHAHVFLCLRVLLTRVSSEHLASVWPIVLMELIRIFQSTKLGTQTDAGLLNQACKFIDMVMVIVPAQFNLYSWMFVQEYLEDSLSCSQPRSSPSSSPVAKPSVSSASPHSTGLQFEPHLHGLNSVQSPAPPRMNGNGRLPNTLYAPATRSPLRRPVLLHRDVNSFSDLAAFHQRLSDSLNVASSQLQLEPDLAFIDHLLLSDLIEYPELSVATIQPSPVTIPSSLTAAAGDGRAGSTHTPLTNGHVPNSTPKPTPKSRPTPPTNVESKSHPRTPSLSGSSQSTPIAVATPTPRTKPASVSGGRSVVMPHPHQPNSIPPQPSTPHILPPRVMTLPFPQLISAKATATAGAHKQMTNNSASRTTRPSKSN